MNRSIAATVTAIAVALATGSGVVRAQPDTPAADAAAAAPAVRAVWVERKQLFTYFGENTYYSCDGLRDKVRYILKQVGARDDLVVSASCILSGGGIEANNVR